MSTVLCLAFRLGPDRYAIKASEVVEILPMVRWKTVPHAPRGVAGLINYRGATIPLLDLQLMLYDTAARAHFGTRIIVLQNGGDDRRIGVLAEGVTEMIRRDAPDFAAAPVQPGGDGAALGAVTKDGADIIQLIEPLSLISQDVLDALHAYAGVADE